MAGTPPTPRTTSALVDGIIDVQAGYDVSPWIAMASQIVTDVCTYGVTDSYQPYTDGFQGSKMELIERLLSAHFYTIFDNQLTHARAGTVSVNYQNKIDMGFKSSIYGQNAMRLDTNGGLARLDNSTQTKRKIRLGILWGGTFRDSDAPMGTTVDTVASYVEKEDPDDFDGDLD